MEHNSNNFLAALHITDQIIGISFLDISTGEFFISEGDKEYTEKLLQSLQPAEIIFQRQKQKLFKELFGNTFFTYSLDEWIFQVISEYIVIADL